MPDDTQEARRRAHHDDDMVEEYNFSQAKRGLVMPQPGKTRLTL